MASRGKESKLDESVCEWTVGRMGGERVRAARPAQLNPCAKNALSSGQIMYDLKLARMSLQYIAYFSYYVQFENEKLAVRVVYLETAVTVRNICVSGTSGT